MKGPLGYDGASALNLGTWKGYLSYKKKKNEVREGGSVSKSRLKTNHRAA